MANLDEIISFLQSEGLMPSKDEDGDIVFKYQMKNYIIFDTSDDEPYLQIALPQIYDVTDDNLIEVLAACNKINRVMKVAKTIISGDNSSVWAVYEAILDSNPVYKDFIPRALNILVETQKNFYDVIEP
ncbi:MAG: YbjN domain-containing protein [Prevotella sp.]|uniref:YbjN domain-containing protein n=1 Tax=Prevotella sp. TaxID=59823 RepID=UPI002A2954BD|nr:YbjN domain-containing protein [Prevotella sp.]MDD7317353.1 YbjN domain-containing protein [Prevotellaceae bacterium]MDY4019451.1 YbjN domain-containing protein [Prevotella sp.]